MGDYLILELMLSKGLEEWLCVENTRRGLLHVGKRQKVARVLDNKLLSSYITSHDYTRPIKANLLYIDTLSFRSL